MYGNTKLALMLVLPTLWVCEMSSQNNELLLWWPKFVDPQSKKYGVIIFHSNISELSIKMAACRFS